MIARKKLAMRLFQMDIEDGTQDVDRWDKLDSEEMESYLKEAFKWIKIAKKDSNNCEDSIPESVKNLFAQSMTSD
jgi:hypothetical protein